MGDRSLVRMPGDLDSLGPDPAGSFSGVGRVLGGKGGGLMPYADKSKNQKYVMAWRQRNPERVEAWTRRYVEKRSAERKQRRALLASAARMLEKAEKLAREVLDAKRPPEGRA